MDWLDELEREAVENKVTEDGCGEPRSFSDPILRLLPVVRAAQSYCHADDAIKSMEGNFDEATERGVMKSLNELKSALDAAERGGSS